MTPDLPDPPGTRGAWDLVRALTAGAGEPDQAGQAASRLGLRLIRQPEAAPRPGQPQPAASLITPDPQMAHHRHVLAIEPQPATPVRPPVPLLPPHTAVITNSPELLNTPGALPPQVRLIGLPERQAGQSEQQDCAGMERVTAQLLAQAPTRHIRVVADLGAAGDDLAGVLRLHDMMFLAARACRTSLWEVSSFIVILLGGMSPDGVPHPLTGLFNGAVKALDLDVPILRAFMVAHDAGTLAGAAADTEAESAAERLLPAAYYVGGRRHAETARAVPAVAAALPLARDSVVVAAGGGRGAGAQMLLALARAVAPRIYILGSTTLDGHPAELLGLSREALAARQRDYIRDRTGGPQPVLPAVASAEFAALARARDVSQTLRELARHCGPDRVSYICSDVRDSDRVDAAISRIMSRHDRVDLLLHVAAVNRSAALERKSLADFRRVRDLKVVAYANLKRAFGTSQPRLWVNTGSMLSLVGSAGEADYLAGNDFLHTAAWHAVSRGHHEITIGFGHWAEAGFATTPEIRAVLEKKYHLVGTTNEEGGQQFLTEVSQPRPASTAYGFGKGGLPFRRVRPGIGGPARPDGADTATPPALPFADQAVRTTTTVSLSRDFDLDRDGYLEHHQVSGHPTLPGVIILEMAAQAARLLVPDRVIAAFEDVTFSRFARVLRGRGPQRKRVLATLVTEDGTESVVHACLLEDLTAADGRVLKTDRELARLVIRMSPQSLPAPESRRPGNPESAGRPVPNPYQPAGPAEGGPAPQIALSGPFASAEHIQVARDAVTASLRLDRTAIDRWFGGFTLPAVLLDALAQAGTVAEAGDEWLPQAVPRFMRRIRLYGSHTDAQLARQGAGVTLWSRSPQLDQAAGLIRTAEAAAVTASGEVLARVEGCIAAVVGYVHLPERRSVSPAAYRAQESGQASQQTSFWNIPEMDLLAERMGQAQAMIGYDPYLVVHERAVSDTTVVGGTELIAYSSYNYLGLSTHPQVTAAAKAAIDRFGTSMSSSRIGGDRPIHLELESELAAFLGTEAALVFAGGYLTNIGLPGGILGPGDLLLHDAAAHRSITDGGRASGAAVRSFAHNDARALDRFLTQHRDRYRRVLVAVEGAYSMDGDLADLPALAEVRRRHDAMLMVDEAHSIGVVGETGRGIAEHLGTGRGAAEFWTGTLSKALASFGGYVAGDRVAVRFLRYSAPGFVFSAGLPPADAAAALAALRVLRDEPQRVRRVQGNAALFRDLARQAGLDTGLAGDSPVVPCLIRDEERTLRVARALLDRGINVNPVVYPGVGRGEERLRFFVTASHSAEQIRRTVEILAEEHRRTASLRLPPAKENCDEAFERLAGPARPGHRRLERHRARHCA